MVLPLPSFTSVSFPFISFPDFSFSFSLFSNLFNSVSILPSAFHHLRLPCGNLPSLPLLDYPLFLSTPSPPTLFSSPTAPPLIPTPLSFAFLLSPSRNLAFSLLSHSLQSSSSSFFLYFPPPPLPPLCSILPLLACSSSSSFSSPLLDCLQRDGCPAEGKQFLHCKT